MPNTKIFIKMPDMHNLSENAVLFSTAAMLIVSSGISISLIVRYKRNPKYPQAQIYLFSIFMMPIFIGWASWIEIYQERQGVALEFLVMLFKSVCIVSFLLYVDRMLGCIYKDDNFSYSEEKKYENLILENPPKFCCCKIKPITSVEKSKKYLRTIKIFVIQNCVVLVTLGIIGIIFISATDSWRADDENVNDFMTAFRIIKAISTMLAFTFLASLGLQANCIVELEPYKILTKFTLIKFGILLTQFQPIIIQIFAATGAIASTSKYSVEEITIYTNALLLCSEMIIMAFLLLIVFPLSDYDIDMKRRKKSLRKAYTESDN